MGGLRGKQTINYRLRTTNVTALLEDIRSLYNVGSCFRTADGVGLERLVLTGYTPAPPRKEIAKTALGAEESVPFEKLEDRDEAIARLIAEGYELWGVETNEDATPLTELSADDIPERLCLLFGNELVGLRPESIAACARSVAIPMRGTKVSYNVAVAFGIACYTIEMLATSSSTTTP